ncbi:MAG: hypothetical protein LBD94_00520 [Rickettsiales bacterium]|jgi:tetratricopeptide (TPR) repeat protein|nr:hypothetical protein [Rickettsiales bacterium]
MPAKKINTKNVSVSEVADNPKENKKKKSHVLVYLYWIAIAIFVGTTCYMLSWFGRKAPDNVQVIEADAPTTISEQETVPEVEPTLQEEPLQAGPDSSIEYRESGKNKLLNGDAVGALNDFTIAVERNPGEPLNYIYRGEVLMSGGNFEAAIADFSSAIRISPISIAAYYDRALANIKLEKLSEAKSDLDMAINARMSMTSLAQSDPEGGEISTHDIYAKRAQVNLWLRNWTEADDDYTMAIAKNMGEPDWTDYTGRAEARTNRGGYDSAIADYSSAVTIISERIQKTPDEKTRENMSRQAMGFFEKSGALRVKIGQMEAALSDLQAAHTLAIALDDIENKNRLEVLISSLK